MKRYRVYAILIRADRPDAAICVASPTVSWMCLRAT